MKILRIALLIFLICLALSMVYIFNKRSTQKDLLHVLHSHQDLVTSLAFSPNGKYLASADESGVIELWNVSSFKLVKQFKLKRRISEILFLPDNKTLVSSDFKGNLIFWDIKTHSIEWQYKTDPILMTSISNNGIMAIATWLRKKNEPEKNQITFIDYRNNKIIKKWKLNGISDRPKAMALSHNGKEIAYVNMDDVFYLKNVLDGRTIWKFKKPTYGTFMPRNGIEFSPDDARIATTFSEMNESMQILQSNNGTNAAEIMLSDKVSGGGISVSYIFGGKKLLVLTNHNEFVIIDKTGKILKVHKGNSNSNYLAIKASPSKEIFAISNGTNIEIWSAK